MIELAFPEPRFRLKKEGERQFIFDPQRKTWLLLTEEEWVRQNFVNYLITALHYPSTLIALEKEIRIHELKKRFDILVYDPDWHPWMLVECKASSVPLNEEVLQQALRYHITVPATYIIITNGKNTTGWKKEEGQLVLLHSLPAWEERNRKQ